MAPRVSSRGAHISRHYFHERISGSLREVTAHSPLGTPTIIGAIADISTGIPSASFVTGVLKPETAEPMTQVPRPNDKATRIRFSAPASSPRQQMVQSVCRK